MIKRMLIDEDINDHQAYHKDTCVKLALVDSRNYNLRAEKTIISFA